jgi:hypothetical protein
VCPAPSIPSEASVDKWGDPGAAGAGGAGGSQVEVRMDQDPCTVW